MTMVQGENSVSALSSTQQWSGQKCTPLKHVWLYILIETIEKGTFIFSLIAKLRSRHPFIEPEPACGISRGQGQDRDHRKHWIP
jgi:hypothetical protein